MIDKPRVIRLDKFDFFCLLLLIPITLFALTPSSYGAALSLFGFEGEGLLFGKPRMIRTDEWAVWTPYIQMAVLNGFERFNELSTYHHDLRGFNAVPLADWALIFKPLMWSFWIFEPARAFALHHGLVIVLFLIGWKRLLGRCLIDFDVSVKQSHYYAAFFSVLLFFTGFVQFWWTTLGPILALSPWLLLVILQWKHSAGHYCKVFYIALAWLLSHTYPPIIISVAYFGLLLLCVHQATWWRSPFIQLFLTGLACVTAVAVCAFYYRDILPVMMNTVYPGQRISQGGEGNGLILISTLFPYVTHSRFSDFLNLNICEVGSVGTLLPLAVICFVKINWADEILRRACIGSLILGSMLIVWTLLPISSDYGQWLLLDKVPGNRTIFILGLLVNYLALLALVDGQVYYSVRRSLVFILMLCLAYFLPSALNLIGWFNKSAPEAIAVIWLLIWLVLLRSVPWLSRYKKSALLWMVLLPNLAAYAKFNPIQQAFPIFDLSNRQTIHAFNELANDGEPDWIIETGYPGAVLSGLGLNAFTTVLIQPNLPIFRHLYPTMPEYEFNQIFNRYAHIWLNDSEIRPYSPSPDVIVIPLRDISEYELQLNYQDSLKVNEIDLPVAGFIDTVTIGQDNTITITGWAWRQSGTINGMFDRTDIQQAHLVSRPDVVAAFSLSELRQSGFLLKIANYERYESMVKKQGICLVSQDQMFGSKVLDTQNLPPQFHCKMRAVGKLEL